MGRRLVRITAILFLGLIQPLALLAQVEVGTFGTDCNFSINYTIQHPNCPQESDGSIDIEIVNGSGLIDLQWISGTNDSTYFVDLLNAGTYKLEIGDTTLCFDTLTFVLNDPSPIQFELTSKNSCPGLDNGTVTVSPLSGSPAEYIIDGGAAQSSPVFPNLLPGLHTVQVIDSSGCYYEDLIEVMESEAPTMEYNLDEPSCSGNADASFIVIIESVSNSENYEYSLDGDNYTPDSLFENLNNGLYNVFVRNESQCVFTDSIEVSDPEDPVIDIEKTDVTCPGANDASFIVIIESVSNSENFDFSTDGINYQPDSIFSNLPPDTYQVFIKNNADCVFEDTVYIDEPQIPEVDFVINEVTCPGGTDASFIVIIESVSNSEDYEYSIDGDNYFPDSIFTDLPAGFYTVYARDESDCVHSQIIEIEEPEVPVLDVEVDNVSCPGGNDASFIVIIESVSNSEDYEYSIDGDLFQQDSIFTGLEAGTYEVFAQNEAGCSFSEIVEITQPETPEISVDISDVTCPGGNDASFIVIIESVSNSEEYEYSIDGDLFQQDSVFTNLEAGQIEVYAQNDLGCVFTQLVEVTEPVTPVINFEIDDVTCPGGSDASFIVIIESVSNSENFEFSVNGNEFQEDSIFLNQTSGLKEIVIKNEQLCLFMDTIQISEPDTPVLDFEIDHVTCSGGNDASFIVIIESVSNTEGYEYSIGGDIYQEDSIFTGIEAGSFEVFIRDPNGCTTVENIAIEEPAAPTIDFEIDEVTCSGGSDGSLIVIIETVSNSESYEYSIDGDNFQPDSTFSGLSAGMYTAYIRNEDNCVYTQNISLSEPDETLLSFTNNDISCHGENDGMITVLATGPDTLLEYSIDGIQFQYENTFENLSPGIYIVTVRNEEACLLSDDTFIEEPDLPDYDFEVQDASCNGSSDGSITVNVNSGIEPFEFAINEEGYQSNQLFDNLSAGTYTIYLLDDSACVFSEEVIIEEPSPMNAHTDSQNETCDYANGFVVLTMEGGTYPYNYLWSTNQQSTSISNLSEGTYYVSVTDLNQCLLVDSIFIENDAAPEIEVIWHNLDCFESNDGRASLDVKSESSPFEYFWSTGEQTDEIYNLKAGDYSVTVTDHNNCYSSLHFTVEQPEDLQISGTPEIASFTGDIDVEVQGGNAPYNYAWSSGHSTSDLVNLPFGYYSLTVTDAMGCATVVDYNILDPGLPFEGAINVYPTITFDEVNVDIHLPRDKKISVFLVDELGRMVYQTERVEISEELYTFNLDDMAPGVYFLRIEIGADFITRKVVKVLD